MKQPLWVYKTLIFGILGMVLLMKFTLDLPELNFLFLFGGLGFCSIFMVGSLRFIREVKELTALRTKEKIR